MKKTFPFFKILYKNLILIILVVALALGASYYVSKKKKFVSYVATKEVIISATIDPAANIRVDNATTNASLASLLLKTLTNALVSPDSITTINEYIRTNYKGDIEERPTIYSGAVTTDYSRKGLIFSISYYSNNEKMAEESLNWVIEGFDYWLIKSKNQGEPIISAGSVNISSVQTNADISTSSPFLRDTIMGGIIGLFVAIVFVVLQYLFDNKVKSEDDIKAITGEGVMAFIDNKK